MAKQRRELPWLGRRGGIFYAFWYDAAARTTQRLSLRTRDREKAKGRFAAFLVEGCEIWKSTSAGRPALSVGAVLDSYFEEHVQVKAVAQERVSIAISHLKVHFETTLVTAVDIPMCRDYIAHRRAGHIGGTVNGVKRAGGNGTIRRELSVLVSALNHAVRWKRLTADQVPAIELPERPPARCRWLTHDELAKLRAAALGRIKTFIEIAYYTAARRRSIEGLTWFQVDLERDRITFAKDGERKTKKRRPTVPIDPRLKPLLAALKKEVTEGDSTSPFVLGDNGSIRTGFNNAVERAGLEGVTPHTLRHTRATHLLQQGVSPWAVAGLLGDTLQTVVDNYGHHCPDFLAEVLAEKRETGV